MEQDENQYEQKKQNFLKLVESRNPRAAEWVTKLFCELEKRSGELEIQWGPNLPGKDYFVSVQIQMKKWQVAPIELLIDDVFVYFQEPRFYFDGHSEAGNVPLWQFSKEMQTKLLKILRIKGRGGITGVLDNKRYFDRIVKAVDFLSHDVNGEDIIWHEKKQLWSLPL